MARPLRIAVWYNLPSGGAKRALYNHLQGLKQRGYIVETFRPPSKYLDFMPIAGLVDAEHEFALEDWKQTSWFFPKKLKLLSDEVFRFNRSVDAHAQVAAEAINKGKFDLLFANTCMHFHAPHIGRYVNLPKLLYIQEPNRPLYEPLPRLPWIAQDPSPDSGLRKARSRFLHRMEARSAAVRAREELQNAKAFDRILVNSFFSREAVLRAYGLNSKVCYLGIDPGMFKNLGLTKENLVIGIGTLGPTKNVLLAIEGVGKVAKSIRPRLSWVANMTDQPYYDACVARAKELDVDFAAHQMIPDAELVSLLNRAKMMVYAPRLEPFGFAPLEANLCGLPTVAVAEGGVRETVVDGFNGLLVDHDPILVGNAITRLLEDDKLRASLGSQGQAKAEKDWGLEASIDRLEAELHATMSSMP